MQQRQRGVVLLAMTAIMVTAFSFLLLKGLNTAAAPHKNDWQDARAMAEAKRALLGYAASAPNRPGELPCPDTNNDGDANNSGINCTNLLGRLPWRTLGLRDLQDSSGERLWYALSDDFHAGGSTAINSGTAGQLTLDSASDIVAVILAPGIAVSGQNRNNPNNASAYLEGENGDADTTYSIQGSNPFNDRALGLSRAQLIGLVENRVVREIRKDLATYFGSNGYYPDTAAVGDGPNYYCDDGVAQGHLPLNIGPAFVPGSGSPCNTMVDWSAALPAWFVANNWTANLTYRSAPPCAVGTSGWAGATDCLP